MTYAAERLSALLEEALMIASHAPKPPEVSSEHERIAQLVDLATQLLERGGKEALVDAFNAAVRDVTRRLDRVSVAVTGMGWLGAGVPAVERTIIELMAAAEREIILTVYSMTPGSGRVQEELERALGSGIRCTLLVNRVRDQHPEIQSTLQRLAAQYPDTLSVNDFVGEDIEGLHAKIVVVDRTAALVGSPNLSLRGMAAAHELAVIVRGPTAEAIAGRVEMLLRSPSIRPFP